MLIALGIYNIFFWNSTLKEKPGGTTLLMYTVVAGQPKPVMLKAQAQTIFNDFKTN
jgi:hypothetical protein